MTGITDDVYQKVAKIIGGEDAIKVIMELKELGEATDDQVVEKTDLKLNEVRRILFKLYNYSIVQCDRSSDKNTGWFIFRWRLQPNQIEGFITNQKRRILRILKIRLEYERNNEFYHCTTPECSRVTFDDAVELVFRCPTCNTLLHHYNNSDSIKALEEKIQQIEKETSPIGIVGKIEEIESEVAS